MLLVHLILFYLLHAEYKLWSSLLRKFRHSVISCVFVSSSSQENREYGRIGPSRWPRDTLYSQKLALIWETSGGRSVGIVRSRTKATELV
jgi:hypothetical protein